MPVSWDHGGDLVHASGECVADAAHELCSLLTGETRPRVECGPCCLRGCIDIGSAAGGDRRHDLFGHGVIDGKRVGGRGLYPLAVDVERGIGAHGTIVPVLGLDLVIGVVEDGHVSIAQLGDPLLGAHLFDGSNRNYELLESGAVGSDVVQLSGELVVG